MATRIGLWEVMMFSVFVVAMFLAVDPVYASSAGAGGAGLPWENGLQMMQRSVSGPVAFTILLASAVGIGATWIFGGDINHFLKGAIYFVLAGAFIGSSTQLISMFFPGAVIPI